MTAAVQDTLDFTDTVLAAIHADWRPSQVESREAIRRAVMQVAAEHRGEVHVSWVRPLLPSWVNPAQIGASLRIWSMAGFLVATGRYLPNGDPSPDARNASKPAPVKRLTQPIPRET